MAGLTGKVALAAIASNVSERTIRRVFIVKMDEHIGTVARNLRVERGIGPERVSVALSMTRQSYADLELGKKAVRAATMFDLAVFYGVPVTYFLEGYEFKAPRDTDTKTSE